VSNNSRLGKLRSHWRVPWQRCSWQTAQSWNYGRSWSWKSAQKSLQPLPQVSHPSRISFHLSLL